MRRNAKNCIKLMNIVKPLHQLSDPITS